MQVIEQSAPSNPAKWTGPLFIVGPSRTGSVLLREILNGLPGVGLFNETHYFDDFRPRVAKFQNADLNDVTIACRAYHEGLAHTAYADFRQSEDCRIKRSHTASCQKSNHNKSHVEKKITKCDSIFADFCQAYARIDGSYIWGDKTPRHVYRIDDILSAFPTARIICTVRDSRATVASYRNWSHVAHEKAKLRPSGTRQYLNLEQRRRVDSYHPMIAAVMWRTAINAARRAHARYGDQVIRFVRFENLVVNPYQTISELASWLEVSFDARCLEVPMQNSSFFIDNPSTGISIAPLERWKRALSADEAGVVEFVTRKQLRHFGYECNNYHPPVLALGRASLSLPGAVLRAARANRSRFVSLGDFIRRRIKELF